MRSELVFAAQRSLPNRYALCRILSTAVRRFHTPNTRIEETTDIVLRFVADSGTCLVASDESNTYNMEERAA